METTTLPVKHRLAELRPILRLAAWVPGYTLYELPAADPFAFVTDAPGVSLPVQMTWSGLHVETAGIPANSRVVLNMVARPWMHLSSAATLGIPWSADKWGRLSFALPPNTHGVFLDYRPPWKQAFQFSLILLLLAVTFGGLLSFRSQSERSARVSGQ